jgi:glycosyltransferase involved in cell wall biosynthesis
MRRVLFWSESFWPIIGGSEIFGANLIQSMRQRGYEIVVITRQDSPDLPSEAHYKGIPIYRFPFWQAVEGRDVNEVMHVKQRVVDLRRRFGPDLIHIHGINISVIFHLQTANVHPTPLLVTLIQEIRDEAKSHELLKRVLHSADWVTVKAAELLTQANQIVPEISSRSSVIRNGLQTPTDCPESLNFEAPRLLCLGRLAKQKGFDLALKSFARISRRFPHVRLVIAGDGPERKELETQIAELGLIDRVDLLGWVAPDSIASLINKATVIIMPSRWEGLPSVALQAAAMGRPVVGTRVPGLSEVVAHNETGLLVEPENIEAIADATAFLLTHRHIAMQMGDSARSRMQNVFGWKRCVDAYDELYQKLMQQRFDK